MTIGQTLRRLLLGAAAIPVLLLATALPASAHPTLLSTTPEAGYSVSTAPEQVTMVFDEPVSVEPHGVRVLGAGGDEIRTSPVVTDQGGRRLTVRLLSVPAAGRYVVRWRVTAQDGDVVDSGFDFAVATSAAGLRGRETADTAGFPIVVILRWLLFLGLAGAIGGLVGSRIADRTVPDAARPRPVVRAAAGIGLVAVGGLLTHLTITIGGGRAATLLAIQAAGLALVAVVGQRAPWLAGPALLVVIGAEALRNHLGTQHGAMGALLLAAHLTAVSIWIGTLAHLLRVAHANRGAARVRPAFVAYARVAMMLFALVVVTGTIGAVLLVPTPRDLITTAYGWTLSVKLAIVVVATGFAITGRRRLTPGRRPIGGPARAEATTLVIVLVATAILVTLPTPAPATRDLGFPLPARGPVVRLGTLAGQIAVAVAASENQLEVRLRVPDDRVQLGEAQPPPYKVSARVGTAGTVPLQPCGPGCFVGPLSWRPGTSYLDVRVDAAGWNGGAAVFPIHWAPQAADGLLSRVRAAMLEQRTIRIVETVTSDTSRPAPKPQTATVSGQDFLDSEPYGNPPDPQITMFRSPNGNLELTFGLPAEGIHVELEVDPAYRILTETLAAPKHLTRRTFSYP
ncbi:copper transport protein [Kribbella sp. VKM Ac-2527]|uniref:Copper transport protein n=1 Tax=Kribbella caucasensis TaxID=2512215 RepID=A0A4R6JJ36_9ACTN|nr:copper resistance protein CopC [Kribbella sp. VKM Ac-2527]TDO35151.1 copper transport protein [Kribbella sp. VKM Ac-2527]